MWLRHPSFIYLSTVVVIVSWFYTANNCCHILIFCLNAISFWQKKFSNMGSFVEFYQSTILCCTINQSINQSTFYSANIPVKARLSGATVTLVFNSKIDEVVIGLTNDLQWQIALNEVRWWDRNWAFHSATHFINVQNVMHGFVIRVPNWWHHSIRADTPSTWQQTTGRKKSWSTW